MYLPKQSLSIADTRLIGYWHQAAIPVYDVTSVHGLNQIIGYVKHNNAIDGTVLYRGQAQLYDTLTPSILHRLGGNKELSQRKTNIQNYVTKIQNDPRMQTLLHFDGDMKDRYFYKRYVIESMLQHYGVPTHFQDFVDNHWTALWFGLYELNKQQIHPHFPYYTYTYARRKPRLPAPVSAPDCLMLNKPTDTPLPPAPELLDILHPSEYTPGDILDGKKVKQLQSITDASEKSATFQKLIQMDIKARHSRNQRKKTQWEKKCAKITKANETARLQYQSDLKSDIAYMYLLLYVADTRGENFKGVYAGTETITIDLRKALPSVLLRPCAQHGWTVRRIGTKADLSNGVVCVLRLSVQLVDEMLGHGALVSPENFFPSIEHDSGYRDLLSREAPAPFGTPAKKYDRDLPSLFPYGTFQRFSNQ